MKVSWLSNLSEYEVFEREERADYERHLRRVRSHIPRWSRRFRIRAFSYTAKREVALRCDFKYGPGFPEVNWRERAVCPVTRLNSRMRATAHFFDFASNVSPGDRIFVMEQATPFYSYLKGVYPNLIGAEYLGNAVPLGTQDERGLRNEDATRLTFADNELKAILSLDVFEHIFDYEAAFRECYRVLAQGGCLVFTVPFDPTSYNNLERAFELDSGEIAHILPPEYHGDILSDKGVLSFRRYGWQMMEDLCEAGFERPRAAVFYSEPMGYFTNHMVFYCTK